MAIVRKEDKKPVDLSVKKATDISDEGGNKKIMAVGMAGSGKTFQIRTLPGRKFVYVFDPNAVESLKGVENIDYVEFYPQATELDATIKGFNKGAKSDNLPAASKREPTVYMDWVEDLNARVDAGFFDDYDWLCVDSLTLLYKAVMDRQLYINNRYGSIEDLADYRVVGSKISEVFRSVASLNLGMYFTAHYTSFQDDKTKKITTELYLPGQAKLQLPLLMTDIWLFQAASNGTTKKWVVQTTPTRQSLQTIRCSKFGVEIEEDVTITATNKQGISRLL